MCLMRPLFERYFFHHIGPTIRDKIFGTKWSDPVKLDRKGIGFCVLFNCY